MPFIALLVGRRSVLSAAGSPILHSDVRKRAAECASKVGTSATVSVSKLSYFVLADAY